MQADTNLENSNIRIEIPGQVQEDMLAKFFKEDENDFLIEENGDYTLELNSNKKVCLVTIKSTEISELLSKVNRLRILEEKFKLINRNEIEVGFSNVSEVFKIVSTLEFEDAIIELSAFNSLIFKLKFPKEVFLIINIPEENLNQDNPTAVFSLLEKRKTIIDNYNTIDSIVIGMERFLDQ